MISPALEASANRTLPTQEVPTSHLWLMWRSPAEIQRARWFVKLWSPTGSPAAGLSRKALQGKSGHGKLHVTITRHPEAAAHSAGGTDTLKVCRWHIPTTPQNILLLSQRQHWRVSLFTVCASLSEASISNIWLSQATDFSSLGIDEKHFWQSEEWSLSFYMQDRQRTGGSSGGCMIWGSLRVYNRPLRGLIPTGWQWETPEATGSPSNHTATSSSASARGPTSH